MEKTKTQTQVQTQTQDQPKIKTVVNALRAEMQESTTTHRRVRRAD